MCRSPFFNKAEGLRLTEIHRDGPKYIKFNMKFDPRWRLLKDFSFIQLWNNTNLMKEINYRKKMYFQKNVFHIQLL